MNVLAESTNTATIVGAVIGFLIWIVIISWTAAIARRKGRSGFLWGLLAFFFSFIPLIVVAVLPRKNV